MSNPKRSAAGRLALVLVALACLLQRASSQHLAFAGLRTVAHQGQFNAIQTDAHGNLFLLLDQKDGIRVLKTDPTATSILAETHLGAQGDIGLALALDPSGNPYIAGTSGSGSLTGTPQAAFPNPANTSTNGFLARLDPNTLSTVFLTFAGSGHMAVSGLAVTADSAFLTGSLFSATLPATPNAYQTTPATGSTQHGFVERFSPGGTNLVYATYLTGPNGNNAPAAIAADSSDNTYIAGYTSSTVFPTTAALVPISTTPAGFLTRITPTGDALTFSTYIPGSGITSLTLDPGSNTLLLTGSVALGQFPITNAQSPLVNTPYQALIRMPLDASAVLASTILGPGTQSVATPGPNGTAWAVGNLTSPLLPLPSLYETGTAFAGHINPQANVDQAARFGGLPTTNPDHASAPITLTSLAIDATGQPYLAGTYSPTASSDLLATEQFDLSLTNPQPPLLPSAAADAPQIPGTCNGSLCQGSAAYLAKLESAATPSLSLSTGAAPNITLRNLGNAEAENLQITATSFTQTNNCPQALPSGEECSIALTGTGPGSITAQATNAITETAAIPTTTRAPTPIAFSPRELDFGIQTATSAPILRTLTITNLSADTQTFTSAPDPPTAATPFSESSSDCPSPNALTTKVLAAGATCHITFAFTVSAATPEGPTQLFWTIAASGTHDALFTGFAQTAALSPSASTIDFGTRYTTGPRTPRFLYLSNNSDTPIPHTPATLPSPFTLTDLCPATLLPHSICQLQIVYNTTPSPSSDAATLALDQGISVLVTGQTLPLPTPGITPNPNLTITPTTLTFPNPVAVTSLSDPQSVTLANTGDTAFPISQSITGDYTSTTTCPPTLAAHATCTVAVTFSPTAPGTRTGILTIDSLSGTTPTYISLTGTATPILGTSPISFGTLPVSESAVQWFKISHSFPSLTATTAPPYQAILVEDTGYGHGTQSPDAFSTTSTSTCFNCYLGLRFTPTAPDPASGTLTLTTTGKPYTVPLTGTGTPITGLLATPASQDFGSIPANSASPPILVSLTNATPNPVPLTAPTVTPGFTLSAAPTGGAPCTGTLPSSATCYTRVLFAPTATGPASGTLTFPTSAGATTIPLSGFGSPDPGLALNPTSLVFENVPDPAATQQTVILTNTSSTPLTIGNPTSTSPTFTPTSTCTTLTPSTTCTIAVTFAPSPTATSANLQIPVTTPTTQTTYAVPLTGAYTSQNAALQILPAQSGFGPATTGTLSQTRTLTLNNLTATPLNVSLTDPHQFALPDGNPCTTIAANSTCSLNVTSLPLTLGPDSETLFASATVPDATRILSLAYLQSYGLPPGTTTLDITGPLTPGPGILDFGQLNSGQTSAKTLTLTNQSATQPINIRRITSQPPFLSTTTCGQTLTPTQTCTVTITYAASNQVPTGSPAGPPTQDIGTVTIESDATSSPSVITLAGLAAPVPTDTPSTTPIQSAYTLTQGSLSFFTTAVGNISPAQTITLTNTGNTTLHLSTLNSPPEFPANTTCNQPIAPAATCTFSLTFIPQANGPRTGALEISTDSGISLDFITLYGLASPPSLLLTPLTLDFSPLLVGTSATQTVTATNNGLVPVTFSPITTTGDYAQTSNCPPPNAILAAGATCTITITFTPAATGPRTGTLTVPTSATTLPLTVPLNGTGLQPNLQITPTSLDFGPIPVGFSANLPMTLTNTGTAPLAPLTLATTGDYATTTCPATLAPTQTCTATITFTPLAAGTRPGTFTANTTTVPLTGVGIVTGSFTLTIQGASSAVATVNQGTPANLTLTVTPTGNYTGPVTLTCAPVTPVPYGSCSILPPTVTLAGSPQSSALTINTLTKLNTAAYLLPLLFLFTKKRRVRAAIGTLALLFLSSCGGGPDPNLRYVLPGTYTYTITASSTSGAPITQTVTATIIIRAGL